MIRVIIPDEDWRALTEFVRAQRLRQFGIEASVRTAGASGTNRVIAFRSRDAVNSLIDKITTYAQTWDVPWAVELNRILPRLHRAAADAP
jgi:extradiol dioxygenase family protein